ncbi:MAG: hypothetical protein JSV86_02440 [Gemmatimonadota bacterium]|nr:MAG: hypothetical protein JSV86_02440 [Gemmatimonadota bacterium]
MARLPALALDSKGLKRKLPGYVATALMILVTILWTFWSVGEMYYEGWWGPWYVKLRYLIPAVMCLLLTLLALAWPLIGGPMIILVGAAFTAWWWGPRLEEGVDIGQLLALFPVSAMLVIIGALFLFEARQRRRRREEGWAHPEVWLRRNARYVLAIGAPLLAFAGWSLYWLPIVLTRQDDGIRAERFIVGDGVSLIWAPEGPGWNWKQSWGGYPSWNRVALWGVPPAGFDEKPGYEDRYATVADMAATGLCRYLSEGGSRVMDEPQDVWRMPTADEIMRSLTRHGENAACLDDGAIGIAMLGRAACEKTPDKETPLWAPDAAPIYYWAADEYDENRAYYVSYNGAFNSQPKSWGSPRHSYRCVRDP